MIHFAWRWLSSKRVRTATQMRHYVWKHTNAQRDQLSQEAVQELEQAMAQLRRAIVDPAGGTSLEQAIESLETTAHRWLKPYASASIRENLEVFLVAAAVVLAFRSFFFQPMAIPTGSAQPSFYGITEENLRDRADVELPSGLEKIYRRWVKGEKFVSVKAKNSGELRLLDPKPVRILPLVSKQRFTIGNQLHTIWFPPDDLWKRAEVYPGMKFEAGDDVIRLKVTSGDHLFVDRMTYNFRRPERGETIVFKSTGVPKLTQNTHYIKRLVGMGGEKIRIGDDRHAYINDRRLEVSDPGFDRVYSFGNKAPEDSVYSGHVNGKVAREYGNLSIAMQTEFPDGDTAYQIRDNHYFVMGDNTMNSYDSRAWLDFPREKVIGKQCFVFWPITERFGWHNY
jgi:signal peptidase I